jgi:hypothetical protein
MTIPKTKEKIEEFKKDYSSLPKDKLLEKYKASWSTISRGWAWRLKAKRDKKATIAEVIEPKIEYIPYPKFDLIEFDSVPKNRDPETLVLVFSDWHIGKLTKSFSIEILNKRVDTLIESTISIVKHNWPIDKIVIFFLGDIVQGENVFQGSKLEEVECNVHKQIYIHGVPLLSRVLMTLSQFGVDIEVHSVDGNHGRYAKEAPTGTNWDRALMCALQAALSNNSKIKIYPSEGFDSYKVIDIKGFKFFITHGSDIKMTSGLPMQAIAKKMNGWFDLTNRFNYAYLGHFHTKSSDFINSHADFTICPTLVTDDPFGIAKFARATVPQQLCFGVHHRQGRTWQFALNCDDKFLPQKYE